MSSPSPGTISALGQYQAYDKLAAEGLTELAALAARAAGVERCVVALLDDRTTWVRHIVGAELAEVARLVHFLLRPLEAREPIAFDDLRESVELWRVEERAAADDPPWRFFAGVPLTRPERAPMGVLILLDHAPRSGAAVLPLAVDFARQVQRQLEIRKALEALKEKHLEHVGALYQLRGLLGAATTFAVVGTDPQGTITLFSAGAERLFAVAASAVVGRAAPTRFFDEGELRARRPPVGAQPDAGPRAGVDQPDARGAHPDFAALVSPCHGGVAREEEWTLQRATGGPFPASVVISEITSEEGATVGFVLVARDITEQRAHERMKDDFISLVSHELRTPLTAMLGALDLVAGGVAGPISEPVSELFDIARENAHRQLRLVNDLLDLHRLEVGRFELAITPCDLAVIGERAVQLVRPSAQPRRITLVLDSAAELLPIEGDPDRLLQVAHNLLSNAVKFSPPESVIDVRLARAGDQARLSVADRGPGIPEEFRARIFSKFAQVSAEDATHRGGSGLGLSIVKAIVELHGGHVSFETGPRGSVFHVDLPLRA